MLQLQLCRCELLRSYVKVWDRQHYKNTLKGEETNIPNSRSIRRATKKRNVGIVRLTGAIGRCLLGP